MGMNGQVGEGKVITQQMFYSLSTRVLFFNMVSFCALTLDKFNHISKRPKQTTLCYVEQ